MRSPTSRGGTLVSRRSVLLSIVAGASGLLFVAPGAARADSSSPLYHSATIVTSGDKLGNVQIPAAYDLFVSGLSDAGEVVFTAGANQGTQPEMLLKWADGLIYTIAAPSTGPASAWPGPVYWAHDLVIDRPVSVNRRGYVLFSADHTGIGRSWGTFLWNPNNQQVTSIALKGMPATGNLLFTLPGGNAPALNNDNEMALVGQVKNPSGPSGYGLFFQGQDGVLRPVLLPGGALPGSAGQDFARTDQFFAPSIDDAGKIAFLTRSRTSFGYGAYVWEYGTIDPVMLPGTAIPGAGKVIGVSSVSVNNQNRSMLVTATTDKWGGGRHGVYRVLNGQITTVAAPGWSMPGGGTLQTVLYQAKEEGGLPDVGIGGPNAAGQHAFVATLADGSNAVYQIDASGYLSLISRINSIVTPPPVQIADVTPSLKAVPGARPFLNNNGQIALSVRATGGRCMIVMLTPVKQ